MERTRTEPNKVRSIRPERETVIDRDEVVGLRIDLEVLTSEEFFHKYFGDNGLSACPQMPIPGLRP